MRGQIRGDRYAKDFSCWDQYLSLALAQLTYRESLRDIEACFKAVGGKIYPMGFRGSVACSMLPDANDPRDWRIYVDFALTLIATARSLYAVDPMSVDLERSLYALDSTTIDLCLLVFPWAKFREHKCAVKMHILLDLHGNIPSFIRITDGLLHDSGVYLDPYLMTRPDRGDPAVYFVGFGGLVFRSLLSQRRFACGRRKAHVAGREVIDRCSRCWRRGPAPADCGRCAGLRGGHAACRRAPAR